MTIHWHILTHHFDSRIMAKKKQNLDWHVEMNSIVKLGSEMDCFFKAIIKKTDDKRFQLRVYGLNTEGIVTIPLQTTSERKAKDMADAYIESINAINDGNFDEFDMH